MQYLSQSERFERLRLERQKSKLSQADLGEQLAISQQAIAKWEKGSAEPGIEMLVALSNLYHTSVDYLIRNSEIRQKADAFIHKESLLFGYIEELCRSNGTSLKILCKKLTGSEDSYEFWQEGIFSTLALSQIADYFRISIDTLLGRDKNTLIAADEKTQRLLKAYNALIPPMQDYVLDMIERLVEQPQNNKGVI